MKILNIQVILEHWSFGVSGISIGKDNLQAWASAFLIGNRVVHSSHFLAIFGSFSSSFSISFLKSKLKMATKLMKNDHFLKIEPCYCFCENGHFLFHFAILSFQALLQQPSPLPQCSLWLPPSLQTGCALLTSSLTSTTTCKELDDAQLPQPDN